jgi:hypothetical protein
MDFNTLTNQINFESLSGAQEEAPNYRRDNSLNSLVPQEENTCQRLDSFQNSLDTFTKRSGTTNEGHNYEYFFTAHLILNLITNKEVEDFRLSANDKQFGTFDDVVVEIKYFNSKTTVTYAVQLKHKKEKKSVVINGLTKNCGSEKVEKYIESCIFTNSVQLIYFTNSKFDKFKEAGKPVEVTYNDKIVKYKNFPLDSLLSIKKKGHCYRFGIKDGNLSEKETKFFNNFYLYSDQVSIHELRSSTRKKFEKFFDCNNSDAFDK